MNKTNKKMKTIIYGKKYNLEALNTLFKYELISQFIIDKLKELKPLDQILQKIELSRTVGTLL